MPYAVGYTLLILAACARAAWGTDGEPAAVSARLALFKHSLVGS